MSFADLFSSPSGTSFSDPTFQLNAAPSGGAANSIFGGGSTGSQSPIGSLFGAAGSIIGGIGQSNAAQAQASGYQKEASLYSQAADLAAQDEGVVWQQGNLQEASQELSTSLTIARAGAAEAGAGIYGGSAGDILRMSQEQQRLILGQTQTATALQANEFKQMQTAYEAQAAGAQSAASAAQSSASSGLLGGILGGLGQALPAIAKFAPLIPGI